MEKSTFRRYSILGQVAAWSKEIIGNEVIIDQHRLTISKRMKEGFMKLIQEKKVI